MSEFGERCSCFASLEARAGVIVNETSKLMRVEVNTTTANSRMILPTKPPTTDSGTNTTTSTRVIDKAANPISFLPSMEAVILSFPISRCL